MHKFCERNLKVFELFSEGVSLSFGGPWGLVDKCTFGNGVVMPPQRSPFVENSLNSLILVGSLSMHLYALNPAPMHREGLSLDTIVVTADRCCSLIQTPSEKGS